jgi:hypothetical protein
MKDKERMSPAFALTVSNRFRARFSMRLNFMRGTRLVAVLDTQVWRD